jgi:hypothetical protein
MCTATWLRTREGYEVFFNRDELVTRKPARPPAEIVRDGVRILAPEDGDAGGTWLGANELGVAVGLANGAPVAGTAFRSRGLLVLDLLTGRNLEEVDQRLAAASIASYRPFSLFAIDGAGEVAIFRSDGQEVARDERRSEGALLFSSSRDAARAKAERESLLDRMRAAHGGLDAELLRAFHASHEPERGAFSPCMHREDAGTVSFSRIRVGPREIAFEYRSGPPCGTGEAATVRMDRDR